MLNSLLGKDYYEDPVIIPSPDGSYQLIIYEWDWLHSSGTDIYISDARLLPGWNLLTRKRLGGTSADRLWHPFSSGEYKITWGNDHIEILVCNGNSTDPDDPSTWFPYHYDLPKRFISDE